MLAHNADSLTDKDIQDYLTNKIQQMFIQHLLTNDSLLDPEYEFFKHRFHVEFPGAYFVVVQFLIQSSGDSAAPSDRPLHLPFMIDNVFTKLMEPLGHVFFTMDMVSVTYLINLTAPENGDQLLQIANETCVTLQQGLGISIYAAVSTLHFGYQEISLAYREACEIMEYHRFSNASTPAIHYSALQTSREYDRPETWLAFESQIGGLLHSKQYEEARDALTAYFRDALAHSVYSPQVIRIRILSIIEQINQILADQYPAKADMFLEWSQYSSTKELSLSDLLETAEARLRHGIAFRDSALSAEPQWLRDVDTYIQENYTSFSISNKSVADHVGHNPAYVSATFKKYRGISIWDHIHLLRIRYAKDLIFEGTSIANAAEQVGYGSLVTMYRAFKKYDHILPGEVHS